MRHPCTLLCTLSFPTYLAIGSHLFGKYRDVFCALAGCLHLLVFSRFKIVPPFISVRKLLWFLLTSHDKSCFNRVLNSSVRPPRVRVITFFSCNRYIYCIGFRAVSDFVLYRRLIQSNSALYIVSVRQFENLHTASFRFPLTKDTLAFC